VDRPLSAELPVNRREQQQLATIGQKPPKAAETSPLFMPFSSSAGTSGETTLQIIDRFLKNF
jgi:hypothetical protein